MEFLGKLLVPFRSCIPISKCCPDEQSMDSGEQNDEIPVWELKFFVIEMRCLGGAKRNFEGLKHVWRIVSNLSESFQHWAVSSHIPLKWYKQTLLETLCRDMEVRRGRSPARVEGGLRMGPRMTLPLYAGCFLGAEVSTAVYKPLFSVFSC